MQGVILSFLTVLVILCSGCTIVSDFDQTDPFRKLYSIAPVRDQQVSTAKDNPSSVIVDLSVQGMLIEDFCKVISDRYGIGLVVSSELFGKHITAELKGTDLSTALSLIARQLSANVISHNNTYFLGNLSPDDNAFYFRRVYGYTNQDIKSSLQSLLTSNGKCEVFSNGVIFVSDKELVIRRVIESLDFLQQQTFDCYIVQLYFVLLRKDALAEAGFATSTSGTISYNLTDSTLKIEDLKLEALFNGTMSSNYADLYNSPMLIVRDGVSSRWKDGQKIPVPQKTVSDSGAIVTTGHTYIDTGFIAKVLCSSTRSGCLLQLNLTVSDVLSYVETLPVTSETSVDVSVEMQPGRIYLLAELQKYSSLDSQNNTFVFSRDKGKSVCQLYGRVYKIAAPNKYDLPLLQNKKNKPVK